MQAEAHKRLHVMLTLGSPTYAPSMHSRGKPYALSLLSLDSFAGLRACVLLIGGLEQPCLIYCQIAPFASHLPGHLGTLHICFKLLAVSKAFGSGRVCQVRLFVCHSNNAAKALMHAAFPEFPLQQRLVSSSASAHPGHVSMHSTTGALSLLEANPY